MRRGICTILAGLFVLTVAAGVASAAPLAVVNGSFEDPALAPLTPAGWEAGWAPTGWAVESTIVGIYDVSTHVWNASDGDNALYILPGGENGIYQYLTATLQPNTTYTYSVDVLYGAVPKAEYLGNELAVTAGQSVYAFTAQPRWDGQLAQWTQLFGTLTTGATYGVDPTNLCAGTPVANQWYTVSQQFTTGAPGTNPDFGSQIKLLVRVQSWDNGWTAFDNVRLDATAVPEPSSLVVGLGMLGSMLALVRKRK